MTYTLYYKELVYSDEEKTLVEGLTSEAINKKGMGKILPLAFFIKDKNEKLVGGVIGETYYGCLFITMIWTALKLRHQGWGKRLMLEAEKVGKERKCTFACVNTMDWEALPFYQKQGYQIEFTRKGFAKDSTMYLLRKNL